MKLVNNAKSILKTDIVSASNSFSVLDGEGELFKYEVVDPILNEFIIFAEEIENDVVIKREAIKVKRVGDIFYIIERKCQDVVSNDTSTPKVRERKKFNFYAEKTQISIYMSENDVDEINGNTNYIKNIKENGIIESEVDIEIKNANGELQKLNVLEILINGVGHNQALGLVTLLANGKINEDLLPTIDTSAAYFGNGSDGNLTITGTTNLNLGEIYEFDNLTIESGGILSTLSTNKKPLIIKVKSVLNIEGEINVNEKGNNCLDKINTDFLNIEVGHKFGGITGNGGNGGAGGNRAGGIGGIGTYYAGGGGGGGSEYRSRVNSIGGAGGEGKTCDGGVGGVCASNGAGNKGGYSSGGSGGGGGGYCSGAGGDAYGNNGGNGQYYAGGGGGAGGLNGENGGNIIIIANEITGSGTINQNGGTGYNGGNGGNGYNSDKTGGGGGGGGGAGGNGGLLLILTKNNNQSWTINQNPGSGGNGGSGGSGSSNSGATGQAGGNGGAGETKILLFDNLI